VPFHVPEVIVPTEDKLDAVVRAVKVVKVEFEVAVTLPASAAFRFATWVVEETTRGGVPVATVEINCPVEVMKAFPFHVRESEVFLAKTTSPVPAKFLQPIPESPEDIRYTPVVERLEELE